MILSVAIPMVTHGIYDFLVMSGSGLLIIIWFAFLVFMYIYSMKKLKEVSNARKVVYQPVSNMGTITNYYKQQTNYPTINVQGQTTFGNNSMYNNQTTQQYVIKYCPNCGSYEPDANFCSQCGTKIK